MGSLELTQTGKREEGRGKKDTSDSVSQLAAIREDIGDCTRCKLCNLGRRQIVFGVGNPERRFDVRG